MAAHIFSISRRLPAINRLAIHLCQQDVRNRPNHRLRRALQQVGKPHQQPPLAQPNRIVHIRKRKKFNFQFRRRRPRTQLPVFFLEKFEQSLTHNEPRLARTERATRHGVEVSDGKAFRPWDFSSTCHSDRSTSASEGAVEEPAVALRNRVACATEKEPAPSSLTFDTTRPPAAPWKSGA